LVTYGNVCSLKIVEAMCVDTRGNIVSIFWIYC